MANEEHLKILKQGAKVWNRWREDNPKVTPDISKTYLEELNLEGVDLFLAKLTDTLIYECNLSKTILRSAEMFYTTLQDTELIEADLTGAEFILAHFTDCNLRKAVLANASMFKTKFDRVVFDDMDFSNAEIDEVSFSNVDLSSAKGLESVLHWGSSTIGIDTLYKSAGKIPEKFLRGCGVPDDFITFIPSHFGIHQAIQFYSCFISYSNKDEEFARRLYSRMRYEHLRVWFAPEDIKGGEKLFEQIERAIQVHDRLLIILSEESMQSEWVMTEIRRARKTEIEQKRRKLFPIRLVDFETIKNWERIDADSGMDIAAEVRSYFIPDFSDWKNHDSFEKGFARLLRDLRAEEERQSAQAETRQR